jgi:cytochrome c oxidase assembly protein subunit 15
MITSVSTDLLPESKGGSQRSLRLIQQITSHLVVGVIALVLIGGSTRVMEAGLACPDWPLCYGSLLPGKQMNLQVFLEWFHRLDAFLVGLALLALNLIVVLRRSSLPPWLPWCSGIALFLVIIQAGLGAFTVSSLLASISVTAHLGTALLLLVHLSATDQALRCLEAQKNQPEKGYSPIDSLPSWWLPFPIVALFSIFAQSILGALMASQWAADRCLEQGQACQLLSDHRLMASPVLIGLAAMAIGALFLPNSQSVLKLFSWIALALGAAQVLVGRLNLIVHLAIPSLTISHQLIAALLVALLGAALGRTWLFISRSWIPQEDLHFG